VIPLWGEPVPAEDFEQLRQLERIAFGMTPTDIRERLAHRIAVEAAIAALATLRAHVLAATAEERV
jgi:hypothetical protein